MSRRFSELAAEAEITAIPRVPGWSQHYGMSLSHNEVIARRGSIGGAFDETRVLLCEIARQCGSTAAMSVYYNHVQERLQRHTAEQVAELQYIGQKHKSNRSDPILYAKLTNQLAALHPLFEHADHEARGYRKELIGGAGLRRIIARTLESTLYGHIARTTPARKRSGAIHELTIMALFTREESADRAALPGLPYEDERLKRDILVYEVTSDGYTTIPLQGTNNESDGRKSFAGLPLVIGGCAIGNSSINSYWPTDGGYRTAHALVAEVNGRATDGQVATLDRIEGDLLDAVHAGLPFVNPELARISTYLNGGASYEERLIAI